MLDIVRTCALLHAGLIYVGLMPIRIQYLLTSNTSKNNLIFLDLLIKLLLTIFLIYTGYLYSQYETNNSVERYVLIFETILFHGWIIFVAISNLNIAKYREIFLKIQNADRNISKLNLKIDYNQIRKESYILCIISLMRLFYFLIKNFDLNTVWALTILRFYEILQTQHLRLCWFLVQYQIWIYYWIVIKHLKLLNSFHWDNKKHQLLWFPRVYEDLNEIVERIHSVFKLPIGLIFCGDVTYSVSLIYRSMASSNLRKDTLDKLFIPIFTTVSIVCCYDILDYEVSKH